MVRRVVLAGDRDWRPASAHRNCKSVARLQAVVGAAPRAARLVAPLPGRSPMVIGWRERPPEMAAWAAKPAATDVVAHATVKGCWRPVPAPLSPVEARGESDEKSEGKLDGFFVCLLALVSRLRDKNG